MLGCLQIIQVLFYQITNSTSFQQSCSSPWVGWSVNDYIILLQQLRSYFLFTQIQASNRSSRLGRLCLAAAKNLKILQFVIVFSLNKFVKVIRLYLILSCPCVIDEKKCK